MHLTNIELGHYQLRRTGGVVVKVYSRRAFGSAQ